MHEVHADEPLRLPERRSWRTLKARLAVYRRPSRWRSASQLGSSLALFGICWAAAWYSLRISYWLTLLVALPGAFMAVRLFILQHDCGHGSLFRSQKTNRLVGIALSSITMTPYECWRRQHAHHHATNANLDRRGIGDLWTWTLREYDAASPLGRLFYRIYRHPFVLFGIGPLVHFAILQRLPFLLPKQWRQERRSVLITNALMAIPVTVVCWLASPGAFLKVHLPICALASSIGVALFYLQHQFEQTYWERDKSWDHRRAALEGSSFLELPALLQWVTANIGYHHIHHLDSRIPNYALARCFRDHPEFQEGCRLTLRSIARCISLKLWDEEGRRLLTFQEARLRRS